MKAIFLSGAILAGVGLFGMPAHAAELVNINTADSATLQTLSGIGPSKAQAIIDYRTQNGPFAAIEDIKNVSGIGDVTYANIKDYITVGTSAPTQTDAQTSNADTQTGTESTGGTASPNSTGTGSVTLHIKGNSATVAGADITFAVQTSDAALNVTNTDFIWNFDDGSTAEGSQVSHAFLYPGKYVVSVSAMAHREETQTRMTVTVAAPELFLIIEGDGTLGVYNRATQEVDIGGWNLAGGEVVFTIPDGTIALPGETLRFVPAVTGIKNPIGARLLFQSGQIAALARFDVPQEAAPQKSPAGSPAAPGAPEKVTSSSTLMAATETSDAGLPWWSYGAALAVLLAIAAGGAFFARPSARPAGVTADPADEFEIEG